MKAFTLVALFATVFAVAMSNPIIKASACDICTTVLGQVIQDCMSSGHHDPRTIEGYIRNRCEGDKQQMPQEWERRACIVDLSIAIPVIERDFARNDTAIVHDVCRAIHICQ